MKQKLNIDKSKWTKVIFGDVVFEPKESCKDLAAENIEHVVGLEHIETEDIHLRNSANADEATTFTKKFAIGDVLFGRRRAYLKKAAQASFAGICSGDITVFRAKENLLPELLPFIVNNDKFFDYAVKHSAGGLSPRVKFKDLANYEFLLPPKAEQAKLAELLWAMDAVIEKERVVLEKLEIGIKSYQKENLIKYRNGVEDKLPADFKVVPLSKVAEISGGSTPYRGTKEYWEDGEIPWLTPTDVTNHNAIELDTTKECITQKGLEAISNRLYPIGSVLYCSRATIGYAIINSKPMATNQGFSNFIVKEGINNYFLYFLLRHITPELTRLAGGSTFLEISKSSMRGFKIVLPNKKKREVITKVLKQYDKNIMGIESKILSSQSLQKSIINEIF